MCLYSDHDGIQNSDDNCPDRHNADQKDTDGDGAGQYANCVTVCLSLVLLSSGDVTSINPLLHWPKVLIQIVYW